MKNINLKRTIFFENMENKSNIIIDFQAAYSNWNFKDKIKNNTNCLKNVLKVDDIPNIKIKTINVAGESDDTLRIYVYKTKLCNINKLNIGEASHALQVSLGNDGRNNWVSAEGEFSAKVFIDDVKKLTMLIEDVALDMQMFYFYNYNQNYNTSLKKREFSKKKVEFLSEQKGHSYLGDIKGAEYVSFASFCREGKDYEINFDKYRTIWDDFNNKELEYEKNKKQIISLKELFLQHPKYKQLSLVKIKRILSELPYGEYILVRTEKKPKKKKYSIKIQSRFGMKKWKTGRCKIVPVKYQYTYKKMIPYVSIYNFRWSGFRDE